MIIKNKKGMTLIELLVGMAIFVIIMTLATGVFVLITRTAGLAGTNKDSQQKIRIAMEMITRYARQANYVIVPSLTEVDLIYTKGATPTESTFTIDASGNLIYNECVSFDLATNTCNDITTPVSLLDDVLYLDTANSSFVENFTNEATLTVQLKRRDDLSRGPYYTDNLTVKNAVVLESLQ